MTTLLDVSGILRLADLRKAPGQTAGWVFGEDPAWLSQ